jgi:hypothetical protein
MPRTRLSPWLIVAVVSYCAAIGGANRVQSSQTALLPPLAAAITMVVTTFAGWLVWGFFTYTAGRVLFGHQVNYRAMLRAFGWAYAAHALFYLVCTHPMGWLWGWVALYVTIAGWGIIGPRQLGMRTWQAITTATLGMLFWLACLLVLTLTLTWNGAYFGVGVFMT